MKPPICELCGKRFDPSPAAGGGLLDFADHEPLPEGMVGHPRGTAWFCRRHYRAARALRDRSLGHALGRLRLGLWARRLGLALLAVAALLAAARWGLPALS